MKNLLLILSLILLAPNSQASGARWLQVEDLFSVVFLDQKDPELYQKGLIPSSERSSLCGPTSAVNWLQILLKGSLAKEQLISDIEKTAQVLKEKHIDVRNGLSEIQLIDFLQHLNQRYDRQVRYNFISRSANPASALWNENIQILMLHYSELQRPSPGPTRRDDFINSLPPLRGYHFVLKLYADQEKGELGLLDPENPSYITRVKLDGERLLPLSKKDFAGFTGTRPMIWNITGLIEEQLD